MFEHWDRQSLWSPLYTLNPRIRPATKLFLDDWWQLAEQRKHFSPEAQALVTQRELMLKRGRARITYPEARSTWSPGAGTGALSYRWEVARGHLNDIARGLDD